MKTISDALTIRRRVFGAFEMAETAASAAEQQHWLTFALVGAGPTGVELAGQIRELATKTLRRPSTAGSSRKTPVSCSSTADRRRWRSSARDCPAGLRRTLTELGVELRDGLDRHQLSTATDWWRGTKTARRPGSTRRPSSGQPASRRRRSRRPSRRRPAPSRTGQAASSCRTTSPSTGTRRSRSSAT